MWHSRPPRDPPPLHGKNHLKFPFWWFDTLHNEKSGKERRQESDYSRHSKSTGCKKCLIVGRVDNVPENRGNVKVLVDKLHLPALQSEFKIVADIKLLDIMCGLQSTSSIHPCPYCTGAKLDKNGRETNGKGTFVKGEPRTMKNSSILNPFRCLKMSNGEFYDFWQLKKSNGDRTKV